MRVVVSYPGVMPAASQVALAFFERAALARYETTFVYDPASWSGRAWRAALWPLYRSRAHAELMRRALPEQLRDRVRAHPWGELVRTAASKLRLGEVAVDRAWERSTLAFDRAVAAGLDRDLDAVYGYEHGCRYTFERAGELGVLRVLDMAAPHHAFLERLLEREELAHPEVVTPGRRAIGPLSARRNAHKQRELDGADLVVANSRFTARTLVAAGYAPERLAVVPLGAPPVDGRWRSRGRPRDLRCVFAGPASVRKGAHLLLEAWRRVAPRRGGALTLVGSWQLPRRLREDLPAGVTLLGGVPQPRLFEEFLRSSVLVFPSLCDGFAMVVAEALAHGLPVVTTEHVGAADLIEDGVNGWVLPAGDVDALAERLAWCLEHPAELAGMREAAQATAAAHPWARYRARVYEAVRARLPGSRGA